jgi:hypothetical protein
MAHRIEASFNSIEELDQIIQAYKASDKRTGGYRGFSGAKGNWEIIPPLRETEKAK